MSVLIPNASHTKTLRTGSAVVHPGLAPRCHAPTHHHGGKYMFEAISLGEKLDREFGGKKCQQLDGGAVVVIITGKAKIVQQIIGKSIGHVASVQL